jgi:carbonic anhydrase/acetyltransferase-like protein (isoleucine patch superfamily)
VGLIVPYRGITPKIHSDVFIAPNAVVIGDVEIGEGTSVWFGVVLRGDIASIRVGARTSLQEGVVVHLDANAPTVIGDDVTIGHGAIIHGCTIGSGTQIGMGAIVLSRATIGEGCMVAAGALIPEGMEVPAGSLVMGMPAKVRRDVTDEEHNVLLERAAAYSARGAEYRTILERLD